MEIEELMAWVKRYVTRTLEGEGAVRGVPCEIETITEQPEYIEIIFRWQDKDGNIHRQDMSIHKPIDASSIYDFDEQVVGSWVNGEPIYRKVIEISDPNSIQKGVTFRVCDLPDHFKMLIKGMGIIRTYENSYSNNDILVYSNNTSVMAKQNFTGYPERIWIIIEYIKQED